MVKLKDKTVQVRMTFGAYDTIAAISKRHGRPLVVTCDIAAELLANATDKQITAAMKTINERREADAAAQ